jgi:hypothetical protein
MRQVEPEAVSVPLILHRHRQLIGPDGGGGNLKRDQNLIVRYDDGRRVGIFTPTSPEQTPFALNELVERYNLAANAQQGHPPTAGRSLCARPAGDPPGR